MRLGDWILLALSYSIAFFGILQSDRRDVAAKDLPILRYRSQAFTVLIVRLIFRLAVLTASVTVFCTPLALLLGIGALMHPPMVDLKGDAILLPIIPITIFAIAIFAAPLVVSSIALERHRVQLRERGLAKGAEKVIHQFVLKCLLIYEASCKRLIFFSAGHLREPGQPASLWLIIRSALGPLLLVPVLLTFFFVLPLIFYALPSIYPSFLNEALFRDANLQPEWFLVTVAIVTVGAVELLQWTNERTVHRPKAASVIFVLLLAIAILSNSAPVSHFSFSPKMNGLLAGIISAVALAAFWHLGVIGFAILVRLTDPVPLPDHFWEFSMDRWVGSLERAAGAVAILSRVGGVLVEVWWFELLRSRKSPAELADDLIDALSPYLGQTVGSVEYSWSRSLPGGGRKIYKDDVGNPVWLLTLQLEGDPIAPDAYVALSKMCADVIPGSWRSSRWDYDRISHVAESLSIQFFNSAVAQSTRLRGYHRNESTITTEDGNQFSVMTSVLHGMLSQRWAKVAADATSFQAVAEDGLADQAED